MFKPPPIEERAALLMAQVWPRGTPPADRLVWEALRDEQREPTLKRLEAVWMAERGDALDPLARMAGLKPSGFRYLRKAWCRNSLAGIIPHETRTRRGLSEHNQEWQSLATELLREAGAWSRNTDVARQLLVSMERAAQGSPARGPHDLRTWLQRAERIVRQQRRRLAVDTDFLNCEYGRGLLVDFSALGIVIRDQQPILAAAAVVMEAASTIILGSAIGRPGNGMVLVGDALNDASRFVEAYRADRPIERGRQCQLAIALPPGFEVGSPSTVVQSEGLADVEIASAGTRSSGKSAFQLVGLRVGRVLLFPRRVLKPECDSLGSRNLPELDIVQAQALWSREVARHNQEQWAALCRAGLVGAGGATSGRIAAALSSASDICARTVEQRTSS